MTTVPGTETEIRAASHETVRVVYIGLFKFVIVIQTLARIDGTWLHSWSTVTGDRLIDDQKGETNIIGGCVNNAWKP